jgi:hypothetical protein
VGPFFPRRDDADNYEYYCASMLALLKPWQSLADLKPQQLSWEAAFDAFFRMTTRRNTDILSGIQYHYDCRSAAERERDKDAEHEDMGVDSHGREWVRHQGDVDDVDDDDVGGDPGSDEVRGRQCIPNKG